MTRRISRHVNATILFAALYAALHGGCTNSEPAGPLAPPATTKSATRREPDVEPRIPTKHSISEDQITPTTSAPILVAHEAPTPTLTFDSPVPLMAGGKAIDLGNHAAPRLVDWSNTGVLDLLVGGGDGRLWLFRRGQAKNSADFLAGERLVADGKEIQVGTGYTGACFRDIDSDGKSDLIAVGDDHRVRYYSNTGTVVAPAFEKFVIIPGADGEFVLPENVGGRIDIADWDQDGLLDLLTGGFEGNITWYRNTGTAKSPAFGTPGVRLKRRGSPLQEPYNMHPRVLDINRDGKPDLAYGINWGYVKLMINTNGPGATNFAADYPLRDLTGKDLNIRSLIADDSIPDFADLTGDDVLDLISGGKNGKLFLMPGVSHARGFERIEAIMAAHRNDLGKALAADAALRDTLFGMHYGLRSVTVALLPLQDRQKVRDWYRDHIGRYPQYLRRRQLDPSADAYVGYLAGQVWVNLFESLPDTPQHRRETADTCGFTGTHHDLLVDLGMIYVDAGRSTPRSQNALYEIAASVPPELQIVEVVTQSEFLKPPEGPGVSIEAHTAVNVFAEVGGYSEGFPPEVPETLIDGFSAVVAHELNHNVEHAAGRMYHWFWDRKFDLLEQAAPPELAFRDHNAVGFGLDLPATQARFLAGGHWDGMPQNWAAAYDYYWKAGPGVSYERRWLRDNLRYCIDAPQEAFATLSNQYFTSSEVMLQLALARWKEGNTTGINQFLFFADVYSLGTNETFFYRIDTAGRVTRSSVPLARDGNGHIRRLTLPNAVYDFSLDAEGNVKELRQASAKATE